MSSRVVRTKLVSYLSRGIPSAALIALAVAACLGEGSDPTAAVSQADGSGSGSGGGSGSGSSTMELCPPNPAVPTPASCLTADKIQFGTTQLFAAGTATGDYPIAIGQENQPPPEGYRADVCNRAYLDCVNGHLLPQEALFCTNTCGGACAAPGAPGPFETASTTYTIVPCGSAQCWHITCPAYGCTAQVACCATNTGSGSGA